VSENPHDPARPDISSQRAVLATARAILTGAGPEVAHDGASSGACQACTTVAAVQFGFALAAELAGAGFVSGPLRARLLEAVKSAQAELDSMGN
jgi:hypothetical protein